jgi:hypothetical protein
MNRLFLLLIAIVIIGSPVFADQGTLIDFNTLGADFSTAQSGELNQNEATLVDFSSTAGSTFTDEDKARMKTSLFIENWGVRLASSSRSVENQSLTYARAAVVRDGANRFGGQTVMGIRVHFPTEPFNSWALVTPPFEIPAYAKITTVDGNGNLVEDAQDAEGSKFNGFGVLKNVGVIKSISMNVFGLNFPHRVSIVFEDQNAIEREYLLGALNFDGWKTLVWDNPAYITEVRNRELQAFPLYPNSTPLVKLIGFRFYRDSMQVGGDFITYIKDVSIVYDKAVLDLESDIEHEGVWQILDEREQGRRQAELERLGQRLILEFLEQQKADASDATDASEQ